MPINFMLLLQCQTKFIPRGLMHPDYTLLDFYMNGLSLYNQHDDDYY